MPEGSFPHVEAEPVPAVLLRALGTEVANWEALQPLLQRLPPPTSDLPSDSKCDSQAAGPSL